MYQEAALLVALLFVSSNVVVSAPIRDGLLPNGNFELGPKPSQLKGSLVKERTAVPNWEITGFVEYIKSGQKQDDMVLVVPQGSSAVRLGNEASISQKISVLSGRLYSITFSAARTCAQDERLNISVTHEAGVIPIQTMYGSDGWDSYSWAFKAGGPEIEIRIHNPGVEEHPACGPLIDAVAIKALFPPRFSGYNLIKNGNFEEGPYVFPKAKWGVLIPPFIEDDNSPLPGWIIESLKAVKYVDKVHFSVPEGHRAIELVGGKESAISQIVRTSLNKFYALTFNVGDARDGCEGPMTVEAFAGRGKIMVDYASKGKGGFKRGRLVFKAGRKLDDIDFPEGPFGTKEAPAVVKSYYDMRIVGCPGGEGEDEHDVVWFWLEKAKPFECPVCTQYFKLQVVGPGGPPDGHGDDHH